MPLGEKQLVAVVDSGIDEENAPRLFNEQVFLDEKGELKAIPGSLENLFGNSPSYMSWRNNFERTIKQPVDVDTIRSLTGDKIRLSLLLNSPGGVKFVHEYYEKLIDLVRKNGGSVDAYVGHRGFSAAQVLACVADERFCIDMSQMMVHEGTVTREIKSDDPGFMEKRKHELVEGDYSKNTRALVNLVEPVKRASVKKKLEVAELDGGNEDRAVYIFGRELEELGVASRSFKGSNEMRAHFDERTGQNTDQLPINHPIRLFFDELKQSKAKPPGLRLV